jgi:hypothetical protein
MHETKTTRKTIKLNLFVPGFPNKNSLILFSLVIKLRYLDNKNTLLTKENGKRFLNLIKKYQKMLVGTKAIAAIK